MLNCWFNIYLCKGAVYICIYILYKEYLWFFLLLRKSWKGNSYWFLSFFFYFVICLPGFTFIASLLSLTQFFRIWNTKQKQNKKNTNKLRGYGCCCFFFSVYTQISHKLWIYGSNKTIPLFIVLFHNLYYQNIKFNSCKIM